MGEIRLFSARACPYAHRSRLVLSHKRVAFELVEIDLKNKPAWFDGKLSAYGKVPALEHGELRIWESAIINEYLDEVFPEPALSPSAPGPRAQARILVDFANTRFSPAFGKLLRASSAHEQSTAKAELSDHLRYLEHAGFAQQPDEGPFFLGARPSLVDFAVYPWFERWPALEEYRGLALPAEHTRLARWRAALRELDAVREHENPPEYYVQRYAAVATPPRQAVA